ncbi:TPA: hypothetical protein PXM39_003592 [Yersinia enterocolitica]|nr:hypothetical protein [Yersinia enterocolitica]HDL6900985.1 hypothetical protein [Yersinia enterocolitica]HDL7092091.1 hypothetical protein [Yersinia enterocolitica]HDL7101129.1 hypothetical protein [Yersinia enterocolitica]HDL7135611.1 hypothetical protein [Yersinia enterocolitica]
MKCYTQNPSYVFIPDELKPNGKDKLSIHLSFRGEAIAIANEFLRQCNKNGVPSEVQNELTSIIDKLVNIEKELKDSKDFVGVELEGCLYHPHM